MFNLDQAIAEWRRQMLAAGIKTPVPLDELESHLREDVEQQLRPGLNAQKAFEIAVRRIGQANALKAEFKKTSDSDETRERKWKLVWMSIGALGYAVPMVLNGPHLLRQLNSTERQLALAAFALTILSLFSGLVIYRILPVIPDKQTRTRVQMAALLPAFIWLCAFAFVVLPRREFTVGRLLVTTLWALCPLAVFGGVVFGLDEAARRRTSTAGS